MDWEMEEPYDDEPFCLEKECRIDLDCEFDAPKFYDFSLSETESQVQEAESWFGAAGNYPPSHFITSCNWKPDVEVSGENLDPNSAVSSNNFELGYESSNAKSKSPSKTSPGRDLRYMNPTASQLAKQYRSPETLCDRLLRRFQMLSFKGDKKSLSKSSPIEAQASKRQKLEAGYLRKGTPVDTKPTLSRRKATIPREPILVTAYRAEIHKSKVNSDHIERAKSNMYKFRARSLNRKILETPSMSLPKRSTSQMPDFQAFHLRTSVRAMQHTFVDTVDRLDVSPDSQKDASSRRVIRSAALMECENFDKSQARCLRMKEINSDAPKRFPIKPPCELFSKLSLASQYPSSAKSQTKMPVHSKGSKENVPAYLLLKHEMPISQWGRNRRMLPSSLPHMPISRSLDIR